MNGDPSGSPRTSNCQFDLSEDINITLDGTERTVPSMYRVVPLVDVVNRIWSRRFPSPLDVRLTFADTCPWASCVTSLSTVTDGVQEAAAPDCTKAVSAPLSDNKMMIALDRHDAAGMHYPRRSVIYMY